MLRWLFDRNEASFKWLHAGKDDQDNDRRPHGYRVHTAADRQTDPRDRPETGGGRQTAHDLSAQKDRPGSQEIDAGYYLSGNPGRIEHDILLSEHIRKAECTAVPLL
jgi:hypothetical protein